MRSLVSVVCRHFIRSDYYSPLVSPEVRRGCYFGGAVCVHSDSRGFDVCIGCSWFVRSEA